MKIRLLLFAPFLLAGTLPSGVRDQFLDSNGDPLASGKLCFFQTGTTTAHNTYSDEARTSANANPVVLDSEGRLAAQVFLDPTQEYRVRLCPAAATDCTTGCSPIWTQDNVNATQLASGTFATRITQIASNVLDEGGAGDGSTDDAAELQAAIDAAQKGYAVDLLGKTYRIDSTIDLESGTVLKNGVIDCSQAVSGPTQCIRAFGTKGASNALTGDAARGDTTLAVTSGAGISVGDYFSVESTDTYISSMDAGELFRAEAISGTTLTPNRPLEDAYTTAAGAAVFEITPVQDIVLENITIIGDSGSDTGFQCSYCANVTLRNVVVRDFNETGVGIRTSFDVLLDKVTVHGIQDSTSYGIDFSYSTGITIRDCSIFDVADDGIGIRDVALDRPVRYVTIQGCSIYARDGNAISGYSDLYGFQYLKIIDNILQKPNIPSSGVGIVVGGLDILVSGNLIGETTRAIYLFLSTPDLSGDAKILGNIVDGALSTLPAVAVATGVNSGGDIEVSGNKIFVDANTTDAIFVSSADYDSVLIHGNQVRGAVDVDATSGQVIVSNNSLDGVGGVDSRVSVSNSDTATVSDNHFVNLSTGFGVVVSSISNGVVVSGNIIEVSSGATGVSITDSSHVEVSGNKIITPVTGIVFESSSATYSNVVVSNNSISLATAFGIRIGDGSGDFQYITVTGNAVSINGGTGDYALSVESGGIVLSVTGNTFFKNSDTDNNVDITEAAAASFLGNIFRNGAICLDFNSATDGIAIGNVFKSCTATTAGANLTVDFSASTETHNVEN